MRRTRTVPGTRSSIFRTAVRLGFTLTEVMVATALTAIVIAGATTGLIYVMRIARGGVFQVQFTGEGRIAAQKIVRLIEQSKAVGTTSNGLLLMSVDLAQSSIYFDTGDGDPDTVADNRLMHDPDSLSAGPTEVLCEYVTPLPGEPMFQVNLSDTAVARINFHVGDGTNMNTESFGKTGAGYQGIEVRASAQPRNIQRWYD